MWNAETARGVDTQPCRAEPGQDRRTLNLTERLLKSLADLRDLNNGAESTLNRVRSGDGKVPSGGIGKCPEMLTPSLEDLSREIGNTIESLDYKLRAIAESVG